MGVDPPDPRPFLFLHYHSLTGGESATRVVVRTGASIDGRLVGPDGAPIAGGFVRTVPAIFGFSAVRTDAHGRFHLGALDGQRVDVRFDGSVAEPGADAGLVRNQEPEIRVITVLGESAQSHVGDLRALATSVLPGSAPIVLRAERVTRRADLDVVVLADGRPRGGVVLFPAVEAPWVSVATGPDGRAVLRDLPVWPLDVHVASVLRGDLGPAEAEADGDLTARPYVDALPGGPPITIRLFRVAELRGRVVDAAGNPVAKAWCAALSGHQYVACFATDADGRFDSTSNVPVGTRLQVSARYPMNKPTSCGVIDGVIAGDGELRIVLEPVPGR